MKKLTAMLLSLMMCFSLLAIPAQAVFSPDPDDPGIIDVDGNPTNPGNDDPGEPGNSVQSEELPEPRDEMPTD